MSWLIIPIKLCAPKIHPVRTIALLLFAPHKHKIVHLDAHGRRRAPYLAVLAASPVVVIAVGAEAATLLANDAGNAGGRAAVSAGVERAQEVVAGVTGREAGTHLGAGVSAGGAGVSGRAASCEALLRLSCGKAGGQGGEKGECVDHCLEECQLAVLTRRTKNVKCGVNLQLLAVPVLL